MKNIFIRGDEFFSPKQVTARDEIPDFKIKEMFGNEKETLRDMPNLESEEYAEQRRNQSAKILSPQQMLSRLPISLA